MDPIRNPYAPGAGTPPPELVGRDEVRESARIALGRIRAGRSSQSVLMIGLRGVGKTVLLDRIRRDAEENDVYALWIEVPEDRSFPSVLVPQLRNVLLKLSHREKAKALAQRALRGLAGFANVLQRELQRMLDKSDYRQGFAGLIPGLRSAWSKIARAMFSGISIVTTRSPSAGLGCS